MYNYNYVIYKFQKMRNMFYVTVTNMFLLCCLAHKKPHACTLIAEQAQSCQKEETSLPGFQTCILLSITAYALCDGLQASKYRTNTACRSLSTGVLFLQISLAFVFLVPNHAQIQSIPGL